MMPAADRWQDLDAEQLLSEWSRGFESTEAAIAHAIWVANRLAKLEPREERRDQLWRSKFAVPVSFRDCLEYLLLLKLRRSFSILIDGFINHILKFIYFS